MADFQKLAELSPLSSSLRSISQVISFKKGERVYLEGEQPKGFYYLIEGLIGLFKLSRNGKENILRLYSKQSYFGYRTLLTNDSYYSLAKALSPCSVLHIPVKSLAELTVMAPDVLACLTIQLAEELKEAEFRLTSMANNKVRQRVIDALIYLKTVHPEYRWTRREIGEFCGSETETVIRVCSQLSKEGFLDIQGREITIRDWAGLEMLRTTV